MTTIIEYRYDIDGFHTTYVKFSWLLVTMRLVVFTVFFGDWPPWMPLTLRSMELNANVSFVVIGNAPPPAVLPSNVAFETIDWLEMQRRLSLLLTPANASSVRYTFHYKANDIKPLAPRLYPRRTLGMDWWAWADLDVIFGDL